MPSPQSLKHSPISLANLAKNRRNAFVSLRTFSDYSLGYSSASISGIIDAARKLSIPAVALTDRNNMFAALEFATKASAAGIQPIAGLIITVDCSEIYHSHSDSHMQRQSQYHLHSQLCGDMLLLAKSQIGYDNLLYLASSIYLDLDQLNKSCDIEKKDCDLHDIRGKKVSIPLKLLLSKLNGLIVMIGPESPIDYLLNTNEGNLALKLYQTLSDAQSDIYIELTRYPNASHSAREQSLLSFGAKCNAKFVATNPVQFLTSDHYDSAEALHCILNGMYFDDRVRTHISRDHYLKSYDEMIELFSDFPEALDNTIAIARKCAFIPKANEVLFPKFLDTKEEEYQTIVNNSKLGLSERLIDVANEKHEKYFAQLDFELNIIRTTGFAGYFLVVADFICWAKERGIAVGCGRGSGVGSIVAWSLKITDVDPLEYGLLFERFLNPERISLPDFDIDFCQSRREEVIMYVRDKYGIDKVANIITFGKLQARAAVRDVGRILQLGYNFVNNICKRIPHNPAHPIKLQEAIDLDKELEQMIEDDPNLGRLFKIALQLEGLSRNISTHAAGVLISAKSLYKIMPIYQEKDASDDTLPISQFSMKYVEMAGVLKFDFLGLKTLTVISETCKLIHENHGIKLDTIKLPLDDAKTFDMLSNGRAIGVFQFDGAGMRDVLRSLRPNCIQDIIALGALYRPGPMENIPSYVNRKHGVEEIEYIDPALKELLRETYGIIIYQEQVMKIAQILANYTLGEADLLRKAMGKKDHAEMTKQRNIFVERCVKNNLARGHAEDIFDYVSKFASYGFNKSHATGYGMISYQTAYLKANFSIEFFTASINLDIENTDKIHAFIMDAKAFGINVLPPSINRSNALFKIEEIRGTKYIRFGLGGIKGMSVKSADKIVEKRIESGGEFNNLKDFANKANDCNINKKILEALTKSGALLEIYSNSAEIIENAEFLLANYFNIGRASSAGQTSLEDLFWQDDSAASNPDSVDEINMQIRRSNWSFDQSSKYEYEALGMYVAFNPLRHYQPMFDAIGAISSRDLDALIHNIHKQRTIKIGGILTEKSIRSNKQIDNAKKFAFIQITDQYGIVDLSIFQEEIIYNNSKLLEEGSIIVVDATVKRDTGGIVKILVEKMYGAHEVAKGVILEKKIMLKHMKEAMFLRMLIHYYRESKLNPAFTPSSEFIDELYDSSARDIGIARQEVEQIISTADACVYKFPLANLLASCEVDDMVVTFSNRQNPIVLPTAYVEVFESFCN